MQNEENEEVGEEKKIKIIEDEGRQLKAERRGLNEDKKRWKNNDNENDKLVQKLIE